MLESLGRVRVRDVVTLGSDPCLSDAHHPSRPASRSYRQTAAHSHSTTMVSPLDARFKSGRLTPLAQANARRR
jgi:hypothetical protein